MKIPHEIFGRLILNLIPLQKKISKPINMLTILSNTLQTRHPFATMRLLCASESLQLASKNFLLASKKKRRSQL